MPEDPKNEEAPDLERLEALGAKFRSAWGKTHPIKERHLQAVRKTAEAEWIRKQEKHIRQSSKEKAPSKTVQSSKSSEQSNKHGQSHSH